MSLRKGQTGRSIAGKKMSHAEIPPIGAPGSQIPVQYQPAPEYRISNASGIFCYLFQLFSRIIKSRIIFYQLLRRTRQEIFSIMRNFEFNK